MKTVTEKILEDPDYFLKQRKKLKEKSSPKSRSSTAYIDKLEKSEESRDEEPRC